MLPFIFLELDIVVAIQKSAIGLVMHMSIKNVLFPEYFSYLGLPMRNSYFIAAVQNRMAGLKTHLMKGYFLLGVEVQC